MRAPNEAGGLPTTDTISNPGEKTIVVNGVLLRVDGQSNVFSVELPNGHFLTVPHGARYNGNKQTVDLPGGTHLSFHDGAVMQNTPIWKANKLAPQKYEQTPYMGIPAHGTTPAPVPDGVVGPVARGQAPGSAPATPPPDAVHNPAPMPTGGKGMAAPAGGSAPTPGGASQQVAGGGNTHDFAVDLLHGLGYPVTSSNVQAIMAWCQAESAPGKGALFNPMNTTQPAPGASNFNSVGVKNFTSYQQGLQATIQTLKNGHYGPILSALQQGNDAFAVGKAVAASPWGTGQGVLNVLNAGHVQNQPIASSGPEGSYGPPTGTTGSGSTGAAGAAAGGANSTVADWDPKKFAAALAAAGFSAHLINSNPDLKAVFENAVRTQQSPDDFKNAIVNTHWYQARTNSQREYDLQNQADHTTLSRQVAAEASSITAKAAQMGVAISPLRAHDLAVTAIRNGLTPEELQKSVAAEAGAYNPQASYGGTYGDAITKIKQSMANYNIKLDPGTMGQFAQGITAGTMDLTKVDQFLQQQAASKYPWLKPQLDQGFTVSQLQSPYKNEMASALEVDPNTIDQNDPLLQQAMQMSDGKGGYTTMPLYQFQQKVKSDPRWMKTNNARNSLMDVGSQVLTDMGLQA